MSYLENKEGYTEQDIYFLLLFIIHLKRYLASIGGYTERDNGASVPWLITSCCSLIPQKLCNL